MPKISPAFAKAADAPGVPARAPHTPPDLAQALGEPWIARRGPSEIWSDAARRLIGEGAQRAGHLFAKTPLFAWTLHGPLPDPASLTAFDFVPGRTSVADKMFTGVWTLAGKTLRTGGRAPWAFAPPSDAFGEALHGFAWLRHLRDHDGAAARAQARALVTSWLKRHHRFHPLAWRPHVTARRLISWLAASKILWDGSDLIWRCQVLRSMAQQARHLSRAAHRAPEGPARFTAALGLALSGFCLSEGARRSERGFAMLTEEIDRQILPDGGHVSRNPDVLLMLFADLVALRATLDSAGRLAPESVTRALDRMAPMVRFLRHGDGRLALFNGAGEGHPAVIDTLLTRSGHMGAPLSHAKHSGYHRLEAGRSVLIADAGALPRGCHGAEAHGAPLAFEFSSGAHRIVVNCGPAGGRGPDWRRVARASAAHSTLTLEDRSPAKLLERQSLIDLVGPRFENGPRQVKSASGEGPQGRWLWMSHDGYLDAFGLLHERRIFLDAAGRDLRGEDRLAIDPRAKAPAFARRYAVRFHLHPELRASLARDGRSVLILLPNGDGWRFRCAGGTVTLDDSIYLGRDDAARKAEQIVIQGETDPAKEPQALVKWAFHRLAPSKAAPAP